MTAQTRLDARRGPYRNGVKRRREIVDAATVAFGQAGYHGASLRAIATMVGTTPASLVAHFGSKEGLLVAVLEDWRSRTSDAHEEHSGTDYFRRFIPLMRFHIENRGILELFLTMSAEATHADHPAAPFILERQQETKDHIIAALSRTIEQEQLAAMDPATIELEAQLMIGALDGIELEWLLHPELDLERAVTYYVDTTIARWTGRPLDDVAHETQRWLEAAAT
jgi:AcrR family transcriptional regulator